MLTRRVSSLVAAVLLISCTSGPTSSTALPQTTTAAPRESGLAAVQGRCSPGAIGIDQAPTIPDKQVVTVCFRVEEVKRIGESGKPQFVILYSTKEAVRRPRDFMITVLPIDATLVALITPPEKFIGIRIEVTSDMANDDPSLPPQMIVSKADQIRVVGP